MNYCSKFFLVFFLFFCITVYSDNVQCWSDELHTDNKSTPVELQQSAGEVTLHETDKTFTKRIFVNMSGTVQSNELLTVEKLAPRSDYEWNFFNKICNKYFDEITALLDSGKLKESREKIFDLDKFIHSENDAQIAGSSVYCLWFISIKYKYNFTGGDFEFMQPAWEKIEKTIAEYKDWIQYHNYLLDKLVIDYPVRKDKIPNELEFAKVRNRDVENVLHIWRYVLDNSVLFVPETYDPLTHKYAWILAMNLDNVESISLDQLETEKERKWIITLRENIQVLRKTQHDLLKQDIENGARSTVVSSARTTIRLFQTKIKDYLVRIYSESPRDDKKLIQLLEKYKYPDEDKIEILIRLNIEYKGFRIWESQNKRFRTIAKFISLDNNFVILEKKDGKQTKIDLSAFDNEIQNYIKSQIKQPFQ
ncbi:MAG: hypothetical protein LBE13_16320 [Bacteroidales bacterium]|jgi:hypothetical protein|nr:hypothetical protein [Bacteroidales bacterium]